MARVLTEAHWRDSARSPRFFIIDARAAFPFVLFLLHIRWWSFILAVVVTTFFGLLEKYGFSLTVFLRWLRSTLAGAVASLGNFSWISFSLPGPSEEGDDSDNVGDCVIAILITS